MRKNPFHVRDLMKKDWKGSVMNTKQIILAGILLVCKVFMSECETAKMFSGSFGTFSAASSFCINSM